MSRSPASAGRRATALCVGAVAAVVALGGCTSHGDASADATGVGPTGSGSVQSPGGAAGSGSPSGSGTGGIGTAGTGGGAKGGSGRGADSTPVPTPTDGGGTEIIPTQTPTPYRLPGLSPATATPTPLVTGPVPATGSARGRLVDGFPTNAVPLPKGLTIVSSSVASEGNRVQVGLEASSDSDPTAVDGQFAASFAGVGYTAAPAQALAGKTATQFSHGTDGVVVTYTPRLGGGTELALSGSFTSAG